MDELDLGDVLAIHIDIMGRFGRWPAPLLDEQSIVRVLLTVGTARAAGADPIRQAVLLAIGLAQARPFAGGRLPTAFAVLEAHIGINGQRLRLGSERSLAQYLRVIAEEHEPEIAADLLETRLRNSVEPV